MKGPLCMRMGFGGRYEALAPCNQTLMFSKVDSHVVVWYGIIIVITPPTIYPANQTFSKHQNDSLLPFGVFIFLLLTGGSAAAPNGCITCCWCNKLALHKSFSLKTSAGLKYFCSELCFTQCRRANFKRNKTCDWCRHIRHTVNYVDFQDGEHQLQFCRQRNNLVDLEGWCTESKCWLLDYYATRKGQNAETTAYFDGTLFLNFFNQFNFSFAIFWTCNLLFLCKFLPIFSSYLFLVSSVFSGFFL